MSKNFRRSAVALVLATTMLLSSQGVLTAFAVGENETSTAVDVLALEPSQITEGTDVADESGDISETETPEVTEPCDKTEGCTLSKDHEGECQVTPVDPPVENENDEGETQPCDKTEGCTLPNGHEGECVTEPVTPPEEENGEAETYPCEKTEGCTLPNGHEGECVVKENTADTQEPSEETAAAVQAVVDRINSLPSADDLANYTPTIELKPEDEGYQEAYQAALDAYYSQIKKDVEAARSAYDALTEEQKAAFDATVLAKLESLENLFAMREQANTLPDANNQPDISYPEETTYVAYDRQSDLVTYDEYKDNHDGTFTLYYTIHEGASSEITIDLACGIIDVWNDNFVMPGDHNAFQIIIKNESSNTYKYKNNSFILAPEKTSLFGSTEDGSLLPVLTYDGQLLPISFSGTIIPQYFVKEIFPVDRSGDVTFEMLCNIYNYLAEKNYTGGDAISQYLLDYFGKKNNQHYNNFVELFMDDPDALSSTGTEHNGIYSMTEDTLLDYIHDYPWINPFVVVKEKSNGILDVQIKWPEYELAASSYNGFYQNLFSVAYGEENAKFLNPNPSGDLEFSRSHGIGDYLPNTSLFEETNQYFSNLTTDGFSSGDTLEIWIGYGLDGPMSNSYQNYNFSSYNIIELEQPTVPTPDPDPDPTPDPDPDPTPDRPSRPNRDDDDWELLPDAPVKDKPEKVEVETEVPEETETPATEQPEKHNPETGDTTTVFAAMALAAVSLGGVVLLGRKKK